MLGEISSGRGRARSEKDVQEVLGEGNSVPCMASYLSFTGECSRIKAYKAVEKSIGGWGVQLRWGFLVCFPMSNPG